MCLRPRNRELLVLRHDGRKCVIGVDLDDVCADRLGVIAALLASEGRPTDGRQPSRWDLSDWGVRDKGDYDRLHYQAFVDRPGYRDMRPISGAITGLRDLHQKGYLIRIVTGRLWTPAIVHRVLADTGAWLEMHGVPADEVAFVTEKEAIDADIYVEDGPHFVTNLQASGKNVIIFSQPYNEECRGLRAHSWGDVIRFVTQSA